MKPFFFFFVAALLMAGPCFAQINCNEGMEPIDGTAESPLSPLDFVQAVANREQIYAKAMATYGYSADISVQTLQGDVVDGEFRQVTTFAFDANGARHATLTSGPTNTLGRLKLTDKDIGALADAPPFALTADNLADLDVVYSGRQKMGERNTSVFDLLPRTPQSELRIFQGRTWVRARDGAILKICGRSNASPIAPLRYESQRQQVAGEYWFPALLRADEETPISGDKVHVRVTVKYSDYRARP